MNIALSILISIGFGELYGLTAGFHGGPGMIVAILVGAIFLAAFLLPPWLFRYSQKDVAPTVLSQLGKRWLVATALTLLAAIVTAVLTPWGKPLQLGEELYMYTVVVVLILHGLAGMYANHVVYLQVTRQYNSNQLLVITLFLVFLFVLLILYFLSFDFVASREAYVYLRDILLVTLALLGFGWHAFRIAHH